MYLFAPSWAASALSLAESDELRITTGTSFQAGFARIRSRISRPVFLGKFKSRMARAGQPSVPAPISSRNRRALSPSTATNSSQSTLCSSSANRRRSTSPGLSSARKIQGGGEVSSVSVRLPIRYREMEGSALSERGFDPDSSSIAFDNLLADCQAKPSSAILGAGM
jgi:hypothetical protein